MYNQTSSTVCVNQFRREMFTKKGKAVESIPPTKDALIQHMCQLTGKGCLLFSV